MCGEEVSFDMDVLEAGRGGREERRSLLEEEASRHASRLEKWRNRIRPSAVLEWDEVQKKVVARRMQVGLSVSHLSPSARESACYSKRTGLVDTFVVPDELAQLKDLKSILSLETWRTCLTEDERQYLCQYLPDGVDTEAAVSSLLQGEENLFAKSPLLLWGSAVCDGSLHPDILAASGGFQTLSTGKTQSGGVWRYYEKLEALWNKRRGVDNHSPAHVAREGMKSNASGSQNKSQLQNVLQQSSRQLNHAGNQEDHAKEERHIDNIINTVNLRQGGKKRKVSTLQEDLEHGNASVRPVMSKWLEKHLVTSARDPRTGEEPPVGVRVIQVSKSQFAALMEKRNSGEDIRLHTLQAVLDDSVEQAGSDALQDHWWPINPFHPPDKQKKVVRELPSGHETFTKRKVQQAGRALLAAQLCVHQRGHVLSPTHLSYSHVAADREAVAKRVGKESLSTNLLDQRRLSYQQASTAEDREQQGLKKPAVAPLTALGRCEPQSFGSCTLSRSYDEDPSIEDTHILHQPPGPLDIAGECLRSSKAGKESPPSPQVAHHLVIHEGKDVSDEESPIHQMWTSVSPDTQILSSAESLEPASKDRDIHGMKLFADFWDPVKPVEGVATMGAARSCLTREEPERATMIGSDHTASEISLDGFSGNGAYASALLVHKKGTRHLDQHESHVDPRSSVSVHHSDFEIGHLHETVRHHGNDGREGWEDHFQRRDSMQHDHRLSGSSPLVLQRGRASENGAGSQSSKSHFTKQPLSNDLFLPSQRQRSQFSFKDPDLNNGQRSSTLGYETNFGKESYYFTAPSKQAVPHFIGSQPQHQEDVSPLHHFEHHRLQASSGMFSRSKSPPALYSEPVHFFPGSQHIVSQLEADQGQGQGLWSTGSEKSTPACWGPSETSPGQTITVAFERPSSPHWEQPSRQQSGNTARMLEMQKNAIHQAHQGWTPIPAVAVSHNNPSPEQGLAGYSLGPLG